MAIVFNPDSEGTVVALSLGKGVPVSLKVDGLTTTNLVITTFNIQQSANFQFQPTLRNAVYLYAFGERMGTLTLGGIAFHKKCGSSDAPFQGMKDVLTYYQDTNVSETLEPVFVSFGVVSIRCFLVGFSLQALKPELNLVQFQLTFLIPPRASGEKEEAVAN